MLCLPATLWHIFFLPLHWDHALNRILSGSSNSYNRQDTDRCSRKKMIDHNAEDSIVTGIQFELEENEWQCLCVDRVPGPKNNKVEYEMRIYKNRHSPCSEGHRNHWGAACFRTEAIPPAPASLQQAAAAVGLRHLSTVGHASGARNHSAGNSGILRMRCDITTSSLASSSEHTGNRMVKETVSAAGRGPAPVGRRRLNHSFQRRTQVLPFSWAKMIVKLMRSFWPPLN